MSTIQERLRSGHTNGTTWEAQSREAANVIDKMVEANKNLAMLVRAHTGADDDIANAVLEFSDAAIASTKCEDKS